MLYTLVSETVTKFDYDMLLLNSIVAIAITTKVNATIIATSGSIFSHSQPFVAIVLIGLIACVIGFNTAMSWSH